MLMLRASSLFSTDATTAARAVVVAAILSALFSTSLSVALEVAMYALFAANPALRARFWTAIRHPVALALCAFLLTVVLGSLHGPAAWSERFASVAGWRKALFLIFALAVFDRDEAKMTFVHIFLAVCGATAVLSFLGFFGSVPVGSRSAGILMHNYATQGMVFAVGTATAAVLLINRSDTAPPTWFSHRAFLFSNLFVVIGNIAFVTPGRSGYLALAVVIAMIAVASFRTVGSHRMAAAGLFAAVALCLFVSPQVRERIEQGIAEAHGGATAEAMTSMGVRTVMWNTTLRIIAEQPIIGVGTGGFERAYRAHQQGVEGWQGAPTNDPHNQFLKVCAEQGLVGLLALCAFIVTVLLQNAAWPFRPLAMSVLLAWCATSLFSSHFSTFVEGRLLFFWLGAMLAGPATKSKVTEAVAWSR